MEIPRLFASRNGTVNSRPCFAPGRNLSDSCIGKARGMLRGLFLCRFESLREAPPHALDYSEYLSITIFRPLMDAPPLGRKRSEMLRTESPDGLDPLLEIVARDERVPLDLRPVVVDRAHGVTQQRGDFRRVVDAQPDQREDAQLGRQQLALFRLDARLLVQQGVEILDERGVEL